VLEAEDGVPRLVSICRVLDGELGASVACTKDELIDAAVATDCQNLTALSGYAHLVVAERMRARGFDSYAVNREIDKTEAMLSCAKLGGNHPWLPRAQWLKRRVNWREYLGLGAGVTGISVVILVAAALFHVITTLDAGMF